MKRFATTLVFLFFLFSASFAFAHDISSPSGETNSSPSANTNIDYTLPYPGLLADSPLYFLKAGRDRIMEFFIADPIKKADFYVLQADKRIEEGRLLFEKGNSRHSLAESVISKGENYFEKGIAQLQIAKGRNLPVDSLIQKYRLSSAKHEEVIGGLMDKSSGGVRDGLAQSRDRSEEFHKRLDNLKP